jgi:uncharacterized protein with gpF-like domain
MIKKGSDGKVIEFEDDAAVAAMSASRGQKDLKRVEPTGGEVLTEEQAMAEYTAAIKAADAQAEADMKKLSDELGLQVAKLDEASKAEKHKSKVSLKAQIDEAERVRREMVSAAESMHQRALEAVWARYAVGMKPINEKLEVGKAVVEVARQAAKDAALTAHKERLAAISKSKVATAKVEAVAAESLPASAP